MQILIADDEPTHLFLLEMFLKKWGYEVRSADNGLEAWEILREENSPALAILDWELPGLSGVEICRRVKAGHRQPEPYIMMLTARAQKMDRHRGQEAGADDYMTKPFDPEELRGQLETACQVLESRGAPAFACSDLRPPARCR